jgi:hypothetical protein
MHQCFTFKSLYSEKSDFSQKFWGLGVKAQNPRKHVYVKPPSLEDADQDDEVENPIFGSIASDTTKSSASQATHLMPAAQVADSKQQRAAAEIGSSRSLSSSILRSMALKAIALSSRSTR